MNKTRSLKIAEINKDWYIANAEGKTLGRFASEVAKILRGKHKPSFTPNMDMGDFVVVINAEKVKVSGKKDTQKTYFKHSGYPDAYGASETTNAFVAPWYQISTGIGYNHMRLRVGDSDQTKPRNVAVQFCIKY